jgi:3-deoxy-D-manno-octulosonic-acid transferase
VTARPAPLALYAAATGLLEPFAGPLLRARARRGKEDAARLGERLGRASMPRPPGPVAWLHAVSVGESLSLLPLVDGLMRRAPGLTLVVTSGTVTSAALLRDRLPPGAIHQYAPVDGPAAVARFLDHWRPAAGIFVESELWPNLIAAARARGVRLALASARITEASARRWARAPAAARTLLDAFEVMLPQDADTETRLRALGARTGPRLNLKRVGEPLPCDPAELARLRAALAGRRIVAAVSTHPGEEALIARAFQDAAADAPDALLLIVPRHPDRGPAVAAELAALGLPAARRAAGETPGPDARAYVADTLGELGLMLRLADVAVMGGAFAEGIGGHNPLEPARLGVPVITGPHAFNAREIYAEMFAAGAAMEAADPPALAERLRALLTDPALARRLGEAALAYAGRQGAALDEALALLAPLAAP